MSPVLDRLASIRLMPIVIIDKAEDARPLAAALKAGGLPAVTTEKDLVRLPDAVPLKVCARRVEVEYLDGWEEISRMILDRLEGGSRS